MHLEFSTKQMTAAMKAVKKMFDKASCSDIEGGCQDCLVASDKGGALLESAGGGLYTKIVFPADVKEPGRVTINRSVLQSLRMNGDRSTFSHKPGGKNLKFRNGQFAGELAVGEAFEAVEAARPVNIPDLTISMPALVAKAASKRTCLSPTIDNTVLRMKLVVDGKVMTLSCNDAFRAAAVRSRLDEDSFGEGDIEVPALFFNTVLQSIEDSRVQIGFNDTMFRIAGGGYDICHPVLQEAEKPMADVFGRFEMLKQSGNPSVAATIDASALREALASVTSVAPVGSGTDIRVEMAFAEKANGQHLTTTVRSKTSKGKFSVGVRGLQLADDAEPVLMSSRFLLEMVNLMSTDEVEFLAWDNLAVLKSEKVGCCMFVPQLMGDDDED